MRSQKNIYIALIAGAVAFTSCGDKGKGSGEEEAKKETKTLFKHLSPAETGVDFINTLVENDTASILTYEYIYNGSGVGVGDIDNDGLMDIYFTSNQGTSKLYHNLGNLKFEDITEKAGVGTSPWCSGVTMADVNNDGFEDIYVCKTTPLVSNAERANLLFINNGDMTFTEKGAEYGINNDGYSTTANFFDMDNDGDLDLFVGNHGTDVNFDIRDNHARKKEDEYTTDRMYENLGNGKFKDITAKAGMESFAFCLASAASDFNNDGLLDLYVSNDYFFPDFLYINQGNGTFKEQREDYMKHTATNSMGIDVADVNNDSKSDLIALDMLPESNYRRKTLMGPRNFDLYITRVIYGYGHQYMKNVLQLNRGDGQQFSEIGNYAGIEATDWSWAPLLADFDNDGYKDLYITNGYMREVTNYDFMEYEANYRNQHNNGLTAAQLAKELPEKKIPNYAFRNKGDLTFEDVSKQWGLNESLISNGAAYADLDNDGDLEIITCNVNDTATIYKNTSRETKGSHYIDVQLESGKGQHEAQGAKVFVYTESGTQMVEHMHNRGYQSSSTPLIHFGLGQDPNIDSIRVEWLGGMQTTVMSPKPDQKIVITDKDATPKKTDGDEGKYFTEIAGDLGINYKHQESAYVDFKREPLIPHMMSKKGPSMAVADVNRDGLDDFIITGAVGSKTTLFLQNGNGKFSEVSNMPWNLTNEDLGYEDIGALFVDVDNDGDQDLYLAAGSNEYDDLNSPYYQDRLFINNTEPGSRTVHFTNETVKRLPKMPNSSSVVCSSDWDGDGDLDLFVGGSVVPGSYPLSPRSYLLVNDNGRFEDNTRELCMDLMEPGMVSMAVFSDYNGDGKQDLVVAGRWTPVMFFQNTGNGFSQKTKELGLADQTGWWNSILPVDIDNDGDMDYVVGNKGLNSQMNSSKDKPCRVYYGDFDNNGDLDAICTQYYGNIEAPVYAKSEMEAQMKYYMSTLVKRHYEYANMDIHGLIARNKEGLQGVLDAKELGNVILINNGASFEMRRLPAAAQWSQIYGMQAVDVNMDGNMDIIAVGNSYDPKVEFGWDDASNGVVLLGDGAGQFTVAESTGFYAPYNAKSLVVINVLGRPVFLIGNNHEKIQAYALDKNNGTFESVWSHISPFGGYLSQSSRGPEEKLEASNNQ